MASGYELRDAEARALTDAFIGVLDELRKADVSRAEKVIAKSVANPDIRRVLERALVTKQIPARTFSPLAKGIANHSSMSVGGGTGGLELSKRMRKHAAGGQS
jgi:hypothetical protein